MANRRKIKYTIPVDEETLAKLSAIAKRSKKFRRALPKITNGALTVPCYVYVIEAPEVGLVKVGISENVEQRLASLQETCPIKLSMFTYMEARDKGQAYRIEQKAHDLMADSRRHGEWFKVDPSIAVKAIRDSWVKPKTLWDI